MMRIRRGLFRLWVVASVIWVGIIGSIGYHEWRAVAQPMKLYVLPNATSDFYKVDNVFDRFDPGLETSHSVVEYPHGITLMIYNSVPNDVAEPKRKKSSAITFRQSHAIMMKSASTLARLTSRPRYFLLWASWHLAPRWRGRSLALGASLAKRPFAQCPRPHTLSQGRHRKGRLWRMQLRHHARAWASASSTTRFAAAEVRTM